MTKLDKGILCFTELHRILQGSVICAQYFRSSACLTHWKRVRRENDIREKLRDKNVPWQPSRN